MELVMKAAAIGIVVSLLGQLLRRNTPEMALLLTLAGVTSVMLFALSFYRQAEQMLSLLLEHCGVDRGMVAPIVKMIAISLITRLGSDVCADSGQKAMASAVELAGTLCALVTAAPLLRTVLTLLLEMR